jgi:DNA processing protein
MTPLGEKTVEHLFTIISNYDLVTISGLAPGTDQYAHNLSLQKKIPTIAILGGGIRRFYKHKDRHLLQEIIKQNGLIISEYKPDFVPTRYSFPQRNRLIAGLSDLVFIPEAGEKSGSLITADFAKAMQKPVYGTPNHIYATQHR